MKILMVLAFIGFGIYWMNADDSRFVKASVYDRIYGDRPEDARFVEGRFKLTAGDRDIDMIAFVRLRAWDDCEKMSREILDGVAGDCADCTVSVKSCTSHVSGRYAGLFEQKPARVPYLVYNAADATERDYRLLTWGLNQKEAAFVCEMMVESLAEGLKNQPVCVVPDASSLQ